jgi:DNA-binding transcriptional regulator YhcF (GntR family)
MLKNAATSTQQKQHLSRSEGKWTKQLLAPGFTVIPSILLEKQKALGLDPLDVNIILQLAKHWWEAENPPFPGKKSIADSIGIDPRTVQRRIAAMEKAGFIQRVVRKGTDGAQKSNAYTFEGLIKAATPYALETMQVREDRKKQDQERRSRKRPHLLKTVE